MAVHAGILFRFGAIWWGVGPGVQAWLKHLLRPDPVLSPAGRVSHGPTVIL